MAITRATSLNLGSDQALVKEFAIRRGELPAKQATIVYDAKADKEKIHPLRSRSMLFGG